MKFAKSLVLLLALVPTLGRAQTAADYVAQGRAFLAAHDLLDANNSFASAVALAPNNADANVLLAATRLLTLANQPAGEAFLDRLGFAATNRSVYGWTARAPTDTNGVPFAPAGVSAAEIPAFLLTNCLPQIIAADANLAVVSGTDYTLALSSNETSTVSVTLDYGDLLLLRAGLNAAEYACYTVCPWDFDVQLAELRAFRTNGASTAQEFLEQYPSLLTFTTTNDLGAARQAFSSAVTLYTNASAFIRSRPLSTVRLFNYDPISDQSEANFRTALIELNDSLNGPVMLTWTDDYGTNLSIDMGNQFTEAFSPRAFFPEFSGKAIIAGTLPDPTFGGVVQGLASWQVEDFLGNTRHLPFVSRFTLPERLPGGLFQIRLDALEESLFAVQVSTNLQDWTNLTFGIVHQGALSFTDPGADEGPRRFYRALDRSGAVGVDLTVLDARTGGPVPGATVVLSVGSMGYNGTWTWISDYAVTNYTDSAGHTIAVLDPASDSSYVVTVAASGYAAWSFDGYLPGDQHRTLSACLAPPGYDPPNDNFAQRQSLTGANLTATGDSVGATSEPGEPYPGSGQTVWWTWTAPSDGAVTIDTSASSFSTALAVFTGNTLTNLVPLVSIPSGSQASFFVDAGVPYQICVDSSDGSSGLIVLRLYYTAPLPPVFTSQPASQTLQINGYSEADFNAAASGTAPISCQWQKDGQAVPGATGDFYAVYGAQASDAGAYTVVASNAVGSATSAVAVLTVILTPPNDMFANRTVITGTNSVVYGYDWSATSEPGEPSLGIGQSVWWTWTAPMDGAAVVDIGGSSGGQVLGVYTGNSLSNLVAVEEFTSVADFFVQAGTTYQMEVDSTDSGGRIVLRLYYTTPSAPVFDRQPASLTVAVGDYASFYAHASGTAPISYQWRQNGVDLLGQTNASLYINVQTNRAGTYTVVATNAAGSATSASAVLAVFLPYQILYSFGTRADDGTNPVAGLVQASNGSLYGTTEYGGSHSRYGDGTVFKLNSDGSGYEGLYSFGASADDGQNPQAGLVQASNGSLYGTTHNGGQGGTVFKLNSDGSGYEVLYNFGASADDGKDPQAGLVQASNGSLYGTTYAGGSQGEGTVFKLNSDGSGYEVLHNFGANANDGNDPQAGLVQASNGSLYGTTSAGGTYGYGTVFKLNSDGSGYEVLHNFGASADDGKDPQAGLVQASNGSLYGTTYAGGSQGEGTVFKLNTDGSGYAVLYNFGASGADGQYPEAGLVQASNGLLYGTTAWGGYGDGTVFKLNTDGSGYEVLYYFGASADDGQGPEAGLIQASDGSLYGTTSGGGLDGYGTVFSVNLGLVITARGSLQVTIAPADALSAGAQWRVDGGTWQNSGATLSNLSGGTYTVNFSVIGGWTSPASQTVTITNGAITAVTGLYAVAASGALSVTLLPTAVVPAGARWQVDGGAWQNSGATVSNLSVGTHTVSFSAVTGWTSPDSQPVSVSANATASVTGTYVAIPLFGSLEVTIMPLAAIAAGAQWQVDGGTWQNSGATVANLPVGDHTVSFSTISGWTTPGNQPVSVSASSTATATGVYTEGVQTQFLTYATNNGTITITGYAGSNGIVAIPSTINGLPVTTVGSSAFWNNYSLTSVTLPGSVTNIGAFAFFGTSLTSVSIPGSVTSIGLEAFTWCFSLKAITVDAEDSFYSSVNGVLFDKSQTTLLECPGGLSGSYATPGTVTSIGEEAFQGCSLTSITMPNGLTNIGSGAFNQCFSLTSVTIPSSVSAIGSSAFFLCPSLTSIGVDPQNPFYTSANGVLFDKSQTTLLGYPGGLSGSYIIPSRVNSIGYGAFSGCTSLINVTNPPSVSSIGDNAFYYCTSLASVYFDGNAPTAGSSVFGSDTKATAYYLPGTSGWSSTFGGVPAVMLNPPIPAGSLLVSIAPAGAITAGAQWQVDGGIPQRRGAAVLGLSVGNHTVSFSTISGWTTPSNQTVSVSANSTATAVGTYVP